MVQVPWRQQPLTEQEANDLFMVTLEDDTNDAPRRMVMGDLHFWAASSLAHSLRSYARAKGLAWYVASMVPIQATWPSTGTRLQFAPDLFVAFARDHPRDSFDLDVEGAFPPFVLGLISPASVLRDEQDDRVAYELVGVKEYALFTPRQHGSSRLEGYRRDSAGKFESWPLDAEGRLWSEVLGLYFVVQGNLLQAQTREGQLLLTPDQAEEAARRARDEITRESEARRSAEEEVVRLRRAIERLEGRHGSEG